MRFDLDGHVDPEAPEQCRLFSEQLYAKVTMREDADEQLDGATTMVQLLHESAGPAQGIEDARQLAFDTGALTGELLGLREVADPVTVTVRSTQNASRLIPPVIAPAPDVLRLQAQCARNLCRIDVRMPDSERHGELVLTHSGTSSAA